MIQKLVFRLLLISAIVISMLGSCKQLNTPSASVMNGELICVECVPNDTANKAIDCEYSTEQFNFHTEGDYGNGLKWQIASMDYSYYYLVYGNGKSKYTELRGYDEALIYTEIMFNAGYGCGKVEKMELKDVDSVSMSKNAIKFYNFNE